MEEIKETDYNRGYYAGLTNAHCDDVSKDKKFIVPSRHIQQTKESIERHNLSCNVQPHCDGWQLVEIT